MAPGVPGVSPVMAPPPVAPPAVAAAPDPMATARADGWVPHPSAPGHHYKGQDVRTDVDLAALYGVAPAAPVAPPPPVAPAVGFAAGQGTFPGAMPPR